MTNMNVGERTVSSGRTQVRRLNRTKRRHNPVAVNVTSTYEVRYGVEITTSARNLLHPTKGWRRDIGTFKRVEKAPHNLLAVPRDCPKVFGYRYLVIPNPKYAKAA